MSPERGTRLVLADDTPEVRALLRLVLVRAGYEVVGEAANGVQAVDMAAQHQPDVVIVDLAMPVMGGLEAIPLIRREAPDAKVIVFSGFASARIEADALAAGAHAVMEKGRPPAHMLATVAGVVSDGPVGADKPARRGPTGPGAGSGGGGEDLSFMVHELMTPLTVIEGFSTMIEARADTLHPDQVKDYAGRVARSAAQLRALIQAVADARRVDAGSLRIEPDLLDLGVLIPEVVAELDAVTAPHPVALDAEPGVVVRADALRLRQVLANLLSNAAKFSPSHESIEVVTRVAGAMAEVAVSDRGPGIPAGRRAELFRRYSRLGSPSPGLGVGLYIARGIATAHGGDLRLDDSAAGACFVLSVPLADA